MSECVAEGQSSHNNSVSAAVCWDGHIIQSLATATHHQATNTPHTMHRPPPPTFDCAGAPGAGDLNCLLSTCSPSFMLRYFESSGWRDTSKLLSQCVVVKLRRWQKAAATTRCRVRVCVHLWLGVHDGCMCAATVHLLVCQQCLHICLTQGGQIAVRRHATLCCVCVCCVRCVFTVWLRWCSMHVV